MKEATKNLFSATATPLASIFGSGFMVIVPILNGAVGPYAWLAMACVYGLAYAMGSVIRFNIVWCLSISARSGIKGLESPWLQLPCFLSPSSRYRLDKQT